MDDNAWPYRTADVQQLLASEDIIRMDWPAFFSDVWDSLGLTPFDAITSSGEQPTTETADLPDLRHRIEADVARISSDTLNKVWDELANRIDLCREMNGAHIEHL
ncbi:hypothetical protein TNCV_1516171 [Trichonephila clavipes]|nr:hypothetical protein TNCV_1516171 [Trichonephila clavipes]